MMMKPRHRYPLGALTALAVLVLAAIPALADTATPRPGADRREGDPAQDFEAVLLGGEKISLAGLRGRTVVVSFWATWCAPCLVEIPELEKLYGTLRDDPKVAIVAVSIEPDAERVRRFVARKGWTLPVALMSEKAIDDYGVESIPLIHVIDPKGTVRLRLAGLRHGEDLASKIRGTLAEIAK